MYKVRPGSLRRLYMNILGDSLKYTKKGHSSVCIEATERSKGRSRRQGLGNVVILTISNTGMGISKENLRKHLLTPFSQEDQLSVGTNLGLSIVCGVMKSLKRENYCSKSIGRKHYCQGVASSRMPSKKCVAIWGVDPSLLSEYQFLAFITRHITDEYGL